MPYPSAHVSARSVSGDVYVLKIFPFARACFSRCSGNNDASEALIFFFRVYFFHLLNQTGKEKGKRCVRAVKAEFPFRGNKFIFHKANRHVLRRWPRCATAPVSSALCFWPSQRRCVGLVEVSMELRNEEHSRWKADSEVVEWRVNIAVSDL